MERWRRIDETPDAEAEAELGVCCASRRWIERMLSRRPFGSLEAARAAGREEWFALPAEAWKEAFAGHPRIGDLDAIRARFGSSANSSASEQAAVAAADTDLVNALMAANREYEARFGYIFIVCARGKTAAQVLDVLRSRLHNRAAEEILIAAEEHAKICDLRLAAVV